MRWSLKRSLHMVGDASSGSTIPEGISVSRESPVSLRIVEKSSHGALNRCRPGPDELADARFETLRTLRLVTQDQHRAAERRHLLLNPSRIREDKVRAIHEPDERQIF